MNSPRISALIYNIVTNGRVDYSKAPPMCVDEERIHVKVKGDEVRFDLKEDFRSEDEARESIAAYIKRWEIDEGLCRNSDCFNLEFKSSIADGPRLEASPVKYSVRLSTAIGRVEASQFPSPPAACKVNSDMSWVGGMYDRYMQYRNNRETLPSMAYYCLTVLEGKFGGRTKAALKLCVSISLLDRIGYLSTKKGGPMGARKAEGTTDELSGRDRLFLEESINQIIRRCAEKVPDRLPQITIDDIDKREDQRETSS